MDESGSRQNRLLAVLSPEVFARLEPSLEQVTLQLGYVLSESGGESDHVYFPTTAIVSLLQVMESGPTVEIAVIGNDGVVGVALFMGGVTLPSRAVVQSQGEAYRLRGSMLMAEFNRSGAFQHLLLRYTLALLSQMAQTAVCNRHHTIDQQLCRWLLLCMDRLPSNMLVMTLKLIANMLGVRSDGATQAVGRLRDAGLISYSRGRISVIDRPGLEGRACECYRVVTTEAARLLPYQIER
ncbi:MAG: Crp/Fnr family transcriptional regulator [Spirochaetaceae bacterium]|nr:MAG: Crp/Fnr family transcriptional regulator [Spirochaetaceae bacterium]